MAKVAELYREVEGEYDETTVNKIMYKIRDEAKDLLTNVWSLVARCDQKQYDISSFAKARPQVFSISFIFKKNRKPDLGVSWLFGHRKP